MDFKDLDLKLLGVFDAVFQTHSVTAAGMRMGLSQPAMSYSLARLRRIFSDPLFIRVDNRMQPTPRALTIAPDVKRVISLVQDQLLNFAAFEPATCTRQFELCTSDIGELYFLPPLAIRVWQQSPHATIRTQSLAPPDLVAGLEEGRIDLAIGYYPDLNKGGFYQQLLFESTFVCIARKDNRSIQSGLSLQAYKDAAHVAVTYQGRTQELIDRYLAQMKIARRVVLTVPHFLSLAEIVPQTDVIATVPKEVALQLAKSNQIVIHDLPIKAPAFSLNQFWHRRSHDEPASQWLRNIVRSAFQEGRK